MLKPLDRHRRDSTLVPVHHSPPAGFVDPDHLLIQTDGQFDFGKLDLPPVVVPLSMLGRVCKPNGEA